MKSFLISLLCIIPLTLGENLQGQGQAPLIIGGETVRAGEFPFLANVGRVDRNNYVCGGVLVGENAVLTTATCVASYTPNQLVVRAGTYMLSDDLPPVQYKQVRNIVIHPNFTPNSTYFHHDNMAILYTATNFTASTNVQVASLSRSVSETVGTAVGWGITANGSNELSQYPRKAVLNIASNTNCALKFSSAGFNPNYQFCAGATNRSSCSGDGGSPFVVGSGKALFGIVSYNIRNNCTVDATGGVFQRVAPYVGWIQQSIRENPPTNSTDNGNGSGVVIKVQLGTVVLLPLLAVINRLY